MTMREKLRLACGVLTVWGALAAAAQAQAPNYLYLFGINNGLPYSNGVEHVPYYSLYPPVYYSMPVPRTYGYSPFAYPPGYTTPDVDLRPAPETIVNPHAAPSANSGKSKKAEAPKDRATQAPMTILNPFVNERGRQAPALARRRS